MSSRPARRRIALQAANDLNSIIFDDELQNQDPDPIEFGRGGNPLSASNTLRGGDTATDMVGVDDLHLGRQRRQRERLPPAPDQCLGRRAPDSSRPTRARLSAAGVGGTLRVVGMNLLNFFNTFGPRNLYGRCRVARSWNAAALKRCGGI